MEALCNCVKPYAKAKFLHAAQMTMPTSIQLWLLPKLAIMLRSGMMQARAREALICKSSPAAALLEAQS
eukprot:2383-Heterococcus_DN1.PRE.6